MFISVHRTIVRAGIAALLLAAPLCFAEDDHGHGHDDGHGHGGHGEHSDEVTLTPDAIATFGITIATASKRELGDVASVPARVAYNSEAMAHVGTPVAGRAAELRVKLGDVVRKGDLLAVIASPELGEAESDFLQKRSIFDAAASAREVAQIAFKRAEELRATNSTSVTDFLARQGELRKAEGDLKVAEAAHVAAENRLHILGITEGQIELLVGTGEVTSRFELRAPIAGRIVEREVTPGEVVGPDREALMVIADMTTLWVLADVPERVAHRVINSSNGRIVVGIADNAVIEGKVEYVAPELNPRTRTAQVRLVVDASAVSAQAAPPPAAESHDDHGHDSHEGHDHGTEAKEAPAHDEHGHEHDESEGHSHDDGHAHDDQAHGHDHDTPASPSPAPTTGTTWSAGALLRPGLFVRAELELAAAPGVSTQSVLAIPEEAVQTFEGRDSVFVPGDEPNTFKPQPVTLGPRVGAFVPVLAGLKEGDKYVATGSFMIKADLAKAGAAHEH